MTKLHLLSTMGVAGVMQVVGPRELGGQIVFSAAGFVGSPVAAQLLIATLTAPEQAETYRRCGLEPIGAAASM